MIDKMNISTKPHLICWLAIPFLMLIGILLNRTIYCFPGENKFFDISSVEFTLVASGLLLVLGAGYWLVSLSEKPFNSYYVTLHLVITLSALALFLLIPIVGVNSPIIVKVAIDTGIAFVLVQSFYIYIIINTLLSRKVVNQTR